MDDGMVLPTVTEEQVTRRVTQEIGRLKHIRTQAHDFIEKAQERQKVNYDKANKEITKLYIGDKVLLYRNIVEASWSAKLEPKWEGLYLVQKIKGTSVWLHKNDGTILSTPVHQSKIKKYHV